MQDERLARAGIQVLVLDLKKHVILERDGFVSLVERTETGFGAAGAAGLMTERGLAPLVWRGERAFFVAKGFETEAKPDQIEALRRFQADLAVALSEAPEPESRRP
jgi:hypothetical protein